MQVSVEKISNVERRLTIIVPVEQIEEAYNKQINRFAKNAKIKGFRPGKVPLTYITKLYGDDVRKEALSEIIHHTLSQAITEQNLKPINTPKIEPKTIAQDQPFEFVALFEVLPEIEKIQFSVNEIEKLQVEITAEDIAHVLEQLKKQYTKWNLVNRPAQEKDRIVIDYYAVFEGKEDLENKVERFPLELGSRVMLPGFEDGLIGAKAGDELTLHLTFPADFSVEERAGKAVDFIVKLEQVFEAEIPTLDQAFIQKLGIKSGTEEDLKDQVKQTIEQERDRLVKEKLKEQIFRQLIEQNPIDVPNSLVAREAKNIHDEVYPHQHNHQEHAANEITTFNEVAKKRVALGLLIAEYAKQNHLKVDQDKIRQRIQDIISLYENPQEVIKWLSSKEQKANIEAQVLEDQVMEKLMEGAAIVEKAMSYAELKGLTT